MEEKNIYDLIIIGSGPAGLTAGIYASRYQLKTLVIGKILGGTITHAAKMCNYPGFEAISGIKWGEIVANQYKKLGGELILGEVKKIIKEENFKVISEGDKEYEGKAIIIATGSERKELGIPGEKEYLGHGVSYCTTCDAPFFREKTVAVIGGADAAVTGAIYLANFAKKVYIIYRRDKLRAEPMWVEEALRNTKIEVIYNTNLTRILGEEELLTVGEFKIQNSKANNELKVVKAVELDREYQGNKILFLDGVFIEIGGVPTVALAQALGVELDEEGFIKVNEWLATNISGVFAAGDITSTGKKMQQVIIACGEGAKAAASVFKYLKGQKAPKILGI